MLSIKGKNVSVADERGEIAGSWQGKAYNDLGPRADILDCCPKKEGMLMLLRSMSPDVIAVDELGSDEEIKAVETILSGGVSVICTVHGNSAEDALKRTGISKSGCAESFDRFIELCRKGNGKIEAVIRDLHGNTVGKEAIR